MFWFPWSLVLMAAPIPSPVPAGVKAEPVAVAALASRALIGDAKALADLRGLGPEGLDVLIKIREELSSVPPFPSDEPRAKAWDGLIDKVARQQHASATGLYWYTDLDAAKARAAAEHKPILSLRLLGSLDDALSCANSRFFRTLLYPDIAVKARLHEGYVLHWESVRDAPKITIDFGGGKVLTRTVTGNSMHYVLDANGRVIDALPGVYGPAAFAVWLDDAGAVARKVERLDDDAFLAARKAAHVGWRAATVARVHEALKTIGLDVSDDTRAMAIAAQPDVMERVANRRGNLLRVDLRTQQWLGSLYVGGTSNPAGEGAVVADGPNGFPTAERAAPLAVSKMAVERPMLPWLKNLRGKVALDETQNDFVLHGQIADLIIDSTGKSPNDFTSDIYAAVFLTPLDDPFMGLAPPDVFSAIPTTIEKKLPVAAIDP